MSNSCSNAETTTISGGYFSGKTTYLAQKVHELLKSGISPEDIVVFCATPVAAQDFAQRLSKLDGANQADKLVVSTPVKFFLQALSTSQAEEFTKRKARLLLPFEYDFLLEDLKTTGIRPGRLREMLKFFYKGFSDLSNDDEEWIITNEERELLATLNDSLAFSGAMLEVEVTNFAVHYMRECENDHANMMRPYVFVDDWHLLSKSSQVAASMLAKKQFIVAGNPDDFSIAEEMYPNHAGFSELVEDCTPENCIELKSSFTAESKRGEIAPTVVDEMKSLATFVKEAISAGATADSIVVASESASWRKNIVNALKTVGVSAELLPSLKFLRCDIRDPNGCAIAAAVTLLKLVANPTDGVAWRSWCGFGDYLANSNGIRSLRNQTGAVEIGLAEVLQRGDFEPSMIDSLDAIGSLGRIREAYECGVGMIEDLSKLSGTNLLDKVFSLSGLEDNFASKSLAAMLEGCNTAEEMVSCIQNAVLADFKQTNVVRVVSFKDTCGLAPQYLAIAGFMNGFFPTSEFFDGTVLNIDQAERKAKRDKALISTVSARGSKEILLSMSEKLTYEDADKIGLVVERIYLEDGVRMARTEKSIYWDAVI